MPKRQAARLILLDRESRVLLLQASDPADRAKPSWWELPGGGIHHGESSADAAKREAWEETGIREIEVGPCVWVRETQFTFGSPFVVKWGNLNMYHTGLISMSFDTYVKGCSSQFASTQTNPLADWTKIPGSGLATQINFDGVDGS